ncbi:LOW QUALITY PROTEIN: hypothetical protein CRUP_014326 [Coryphaenoides rupestris]|nr:LOW QUALITY PROTEIN: hypothetical protein CRUP_014326 [Coryphaenoides rupestris]
MVGLAKLPVHHSVEHGVDAAVEPGTASFVLERYPMAAHLTGACVCRPTDHATVVLRTRPRGRSDFLPGGAAAGPVADQSPGGDLDTLVYEEVEDTHAAQPHQKVGEEQDGGVGAAPRPVEAARAHLGDEDIDGPEGSEASQGQDPGGGQEERQAAVGEDALERGPLHHQEVAAGGDQAEGDDGHRVGEEEEQAEHLAPLLPPTPAQVQESTEMGCSTVQYNRSASARLTMSTLKRVRRRASEAKARMVIRFPTVPVRVTRQPHSTAKYRYPTTDITPVSVNPRKTTFSTPLPAATPAEAMHVDHVHMEAVMFNIQQLARESKTAQGTSEREKQWELCEGWARVNGTVLLGKTVEGAAEGLEEAVRACESLGVGCAGVTHGGSLKPGQSKYNAVLKKGSRVVHSDAAESECWIRVCKVEKETLFSCRRSKRSPGIHCNNRKEESIYSVVEWIPAVSTLYNLGTAVMAKERALLSAVDLGTDALMAATGGVAGVAGYALGAGVKTGVKASIKYLLSSMKEEEDLMVNQYSWEDGGPPHA